MGIEVGHMYVDLSIVDIFAFSKKGLITKMAVDHHTLIDPTYFSHA